MSTNSAELPLDRPLRWSGAAGRPRGITLPPARMPLLRAWRLLKRWRFVGVWTEEIFACAGSVSVGPVPQEFWAVWDRASRRFYERTRFLKGRVQLPPGRCIVRDGDVSFDLTLDEDEGVEVVTPDGRAYTWTRKQIIPVRGTIRFGGREQNVAATAFIDDNAGYHARRMKWKWSGGVGEATDGRPVAWNLITGLNDSPLASENTVWVGGAPGEVGPVSFAEDLSSVSFTEGGTLRFTEETVRARRDNLLVIRSDYAQPMGTYQGTLPGGLELLRGYGVMERHTALW
jgi:hypothetical protein